MAYTPPTPSPVHRTLTVAVVLLFAGGLLAAATATSAHVGHGSDGWTPSYDVDALGRPEPPGMAGPLVAEGEPGPVPASTMQAGDVSFETLDVESDYADESYKNEYVVNTRTAQDVENQSTNWDTALGHRIKFTIEIDDGRQNLDCDDRFVAVALIETTSGPLYGWTNGTYRTDAPGGADDVCLDGLPGVRIYEVIFDLDGSPPTVTGTPFPALLSGFYTARLELYHHDPGPTDPGGQGPLAGVHEIGFALQDPRLSLSEPLYRFPERMLRLFSDTGGHATHTNQFAMPIRAMTPGETWNLTMRFDGLAEGTEFTRVDHYALRTVPGAQLPSDPGTSLGGTPLDPLLDKIQEQDERTAQIERNPFTLTPNTVPADRVRMMNISASDFAPQTQLLDEYVPLHVVTIIAPATMDTFATGAESIVVPVSDRDYPLRNMDVTEDLPDFPATLVRLQDDEQATGGPTGVQAGDLFALRAVGSGHEMITRNVLEREPDDRWLEGELPHMDFVDDVRKYRIVAMMYGPLDEFFGMRVFERGIEIEAEGDRYVEGTSGTAHVTVTHLSVEQDGQGVRDGIELTIRVTASGLPDDKSFARNITLEEGASRTIEVPLTGATPGNYPVRFTATGGELTTNTETTIEVISRVQAREENRKWYEIPALDAVLVALALMAVVAVVARRRA